MMLMVAKIPLLAVERGRRSADNLDPFDQIEVDGEVGSQKDNVVGHVMAIHHNQKAAGQIEAPHPHDRKRIMRSVVALGLISLLMPVATPLLGV